MIPDCPTGPATPEYAWAKELSDELQAIHADEMEAAGISASHVRNARMLALTLRDALATEQERGMVSSRVYWTVVVCFFIAFACAMVLAVLLVLKP